MFEHFKIYHRLRASSAYDLYLFVKDRRLLRERGNEIAFYRALLANFRPGQPIFDIGANIGDKTELFLRLGAHVVAVDPDESNQTILRQKFLRYRQTPCNVSIVGKAVGASVGVATMLICAPGSVFNTLSKKGAGSAADIGRQVRPATEDIDYSAKRSVEITTLDQLIDTFGIPSFIKIDVVGFELEVLQGLHRPVPCLSFEIDLPGFRSELVQCVELLAKLSSSGEFNYTWDRRNGLVLDRWVDSNAFQKVLEACIEGPLEVVWRTPGSTL